MTQTPADGLARVALGFIEMAHRIVWCVAATVDRQGRPRTRVLHPIWDWDGTKLTGWVATSPQSPKAGHLAGKPEVSMTYWDDQHDTCTADCRARWLTDPVERHATWNRFAHAPEPVGYDPSMIPGWTSPDAPEFGVLELEPWRLRVFPGTMLVEGAGEVLVWSE